MTCFEFPQNNITYSKASVVCPRPRRFGVWCPDTLSLLEFTNPCNLTEAGNAKAEAELLDIILEKETSGSGQTVTQLGSSPPFFSGSPPIRAANPLVQDALFGDAKLSSLCPSNVSCLFPSALGGVHVRGKYGDKTAAVRVEGFDCLSSDRRNSRAPAIG